MRRLIVATSASAYRGLIGSCRHDFQQGPVALQRRKQSDRCRMSATSSTAIMPDALVCMPAGCEANLETHRCCLGIPQRIPPLVPELLRSHGVLRCVTNSQACSALLSGSAGRCSCLFKPYHAMAAWLICSAVGCGMSCQESQQRRSNTTCRAVLMRVVCAGPLGAVRPLDRPAWLYADPADLRHLGY